MWLDPVDTVLCTFGSTAQLPSNNPFPQNFAVPRVANLILWITQGILVIVLIEFAQG